jgi:drug/metabolite transporter (DMT)-like permease
MSQRKSATTQKAKEFEKETSKVEKETSKSTEKPGLSLSSVLYGAFVVFCWYGFSASYNVYSQQMKVLPFAMTASLLQLIVGCLFAIPLWVLGLRDWPKVPISELVITLLPVAFLNAVGHAVALASMFRKGGGSFTQVIKASEPVVSVVLALFLNGVVPKPLSALSLLPVMYGVAYASTKGNLTMSALSSELLTTGSALAMSSNACFGMRSIMRKGQSKDFKAKVDADNDHAITELLSLVLTIPLLLFEDMTEVRMTLASMTPDMVNTLLVSAIGSGLSFFLYNMFQNRVLSSLGPVPTAVGNTAKRVVIFFGLYLFIEGETFPPAKILGCAIAVGGCLLYAICNAYKV